MLADGVQMPPLVAQIMQNAGGPANAKPVTVEPSALAKMPVVNKLDLSAYPDNPLKIVMDIRDDPRRWWQKTSGENRRPVVSGRSLPLHQRTRPRSCLLVKADTTGREADQVFFRTDYAKLRSPSPATMPAPSDEAVVAVGIGR